MSGFILSEADLRERAWLLQADAISRIRCGRTLDETAGRYTLKLASAVQKRIAVVRACIFPADLSGRKFRMIFH
jgi:ABC-type arginine transport system ATPase subunit